MSIRIANWNLDRATEKWRQEAICTKLASIKADIWILTETRNSISPGDGFKCIARSVSNPVSNPEHEPDESWVSIWTKQLRLIEENITTDLAFSASATVALPNGTPLTVFGTVLPWRGRTWKGLPSAGAIAFEAALQVHQTDWQAFLMKHGGVLCVAGDFNQDLSEKPYYWSRRASRILDVVVNGKESNLMAVTAFDSDPVRTISNGKEACIDHICISRKLAEKQEVKAKAWLPQVDGRTLSDHPGVYIDLIEL